jgi:hypothetical protein
LRREDLPFNPKGVVGLGEILAKIFLLTAGSVEVAPGRCD